MSRATKAMLIRLKYLSIKGLMVGPKAAKRPATMKNLAERLIVDPMRNAGKLIAAMPAVMVHTL